VYAGSFGDLFSPSGTYSPTQDELFPAEAQWTLARSEINTNHIGVLCVSVKSAAKSVLQLGEAQTQPVDIITVREGQNRNRKRYEKILRTPFITTHIRLSESLREKVCGIEDYLRGVDSHQVYSLPSRLHITVKELGWLGEDFKRDDLSEVMSIIRDVASKRRPFVLSIEGIGVFPTVVYGRIGKGADEIRRLNMELTEKLVGRAIHGEYDGEKMEPHVTMVHFATRSVEPLLNEVSRLETKFVGEMLVKEIRVVKYQARRLFGIPARETLATLSLGRREPLLS
jgi:2'-5' RNA ligase